MDEIILDDPHSQNISMVKQCFKDCIGLEFKHNDIHSGESICENRCVAKYMEALDLVKKTLAEIESQEPSNNVQ